MTPDRNALTQDATIVAERHLLLPHDLSREGLGRALSIVTRKSTDFADLYFESTSNESWQLRDGKVSQGSYALSQGVGVRAVEQDRTAFAYSAELSPRALDAAIGAVVSMTGHGDTGATQAGVAMTPSCGTPSLYPRIDPTEVGDAATKIGILQTIECKARAADPRILRVTATLQCSSSIVLIAASDGTLTGDVRPQVQVQLAIVAEQRGRRAMGSASEGGRHALDAFDEARIDDLVRRATAMALVNLDARPAPAGVMPVVLGPGIPGVLLHEAVGHGLEGDSHRDRASVFAGRMGERVAAEGVTVLDDGTQVGMTGALSIDDEGTPGKRNVLIENGRLCGLMQDRMNAGLMNQAVTGNARRQSYAHLTMPRMTNTFLAAGDKDPAEIIASVKRGLYATTFGGGTVDITSGQFNFSAIEAFLIEDGRITAPVEGATLIGLGHEALNHISMIGNDLALASGACGKRGQKVPVCVGQPTIRINEIVVGGTA